MAAITPPKPTEDYKRLQLIEQKVIACVKIAAQVTDHFSRVGRTAELAGSVQQLCASFMTTIAEALQLVREGAEAAAGGEHRLELHAYHSMARAHINTEKLQVMRMHLEAMQEELEAAGALGAGEGGAGASGGEAGGAAGPEGPADGVGPAGEGQGVAGAAGQPLALANGHAGPGGEGGGAVGGGGVAAMEE
ncbi:hypothetical protein HYH03_001258 [Edaphochlamys debaryana]|uniref:Mediator of RNA polymerase II transcription subunit 11 n=1 Tax=Edaphochlamys debaryana TaxID=47281 RepID=A0A835YEQ2_9CHLO|nr:hypothetical protein HYH03_001258 [Edaphochlamys debaryana]|eukprot:KAG2501480.1 hypothetical protein HYH03_001258 [Edaphochlamys debaryana]